MKTLLKLTCLSALLATTACMESRTEDAKDVARSQAAIAKDNQAIANQQENLMENRAEKAAAKASGDPVRQASESMQIGANKAAIAAKEMELNADQKILEQDRMNYAKH